jgi:DNA-binding transcriptional MerR regulator
VFRWVEALVEELYVPVEAGYLTPSSRVGLVGCCGHQSGSFGFETGPAEHGSQLPGGLLVGFDLHWMSPSVLGCAGVDRPGLPLLPAPVPGEVFDGLVHVVSDGMNVGGVPGSAHCDVPEFSPAAVGEEVGGTEGCPCQLATTLENEHMMVFIGTGPMVASMESFTTDQVIRITGVSRRRLAYWLDRGIVSADIDKARGRGRVRLWSFRNLLEVRVALWLRDRLSLQLIGRVVKELRKAGLSSPLATIRFAVIAGGGRRGDNVVIQTGSGEWSHPIMGQIIFEGTLPLQRFGEELTVAADRDYKRRRRAGMVERRRAKLDPSRFRRDPYPCRAGRSPSFSGLGSQADPRQLPGPDGS